MPPLPSSATRRYRPAMMEPGAKRPARATGVVVGPLDGATVTSSGGVIGTTEFYLEDLLLWHREQSLPCSSQHSSPPAACSRRVDARRVLPAAPRRRSVANTTRAAPNRSIGTGNGLRSRTDVRSSADAISSPGAAPTTAR